MSLILMGRRRGRRQVVAVAAQVRRYDGGSGSTLVSCGFPCRPGDVTESMVAGREVRVFVGGVEQSVAVQPLRGRHPDGTYRALGVQFSYTIPDANPITAEVRFGEVRGTSDISWVEPVESHVYAVSGSTGVANGRVIIPTDPAYLCATWCAFQPLQPATEDTGAPLVNYFGTFAEDRAIVACQTNNALPLSTYDHVRALIALWCRTGNAVYHQLAYLWTGRMMRAYAGGPFGVNGSSLDTISCTSGTWSRGRGDNPSLNVNSRLLVNGRRYDVLTVDSGGLTGTLQADATDPSAPTTFSSGSYRSIEPFFELINPEGLPQESTPGSFIGGLGAQPPEQHTQFHWSCASSYLLTGWKQPWRYLALSKQRRNANNDTLVKSLAVVNFSNPSGVISADQEVRYNLMCFESLMAAQCVEATLAPTGGWANSNAQINMVNQLRWALQAINDNRHAAGNWTDGIRGRASSALSGLGRIAHFHLSLGCKALLHYYLLIERDENIPTWIQETFDVAVQHIEPLLANAAGGGHNTYNFGARWWHYYDADPNKPPATRPEAYLVRTSVSASAGTATFTTTPGSNLANGNVLRVNGNFYLVSGYTSGGTTCTITADPETPSAPLTFGAFDYIIIVNDRNPYTLPMFADTAAFLYAHTGNTSYRSWTERFAEEGNVTPNVLTWGTSSVSLKLFGELFGHNQSAPYFYTKATIPTYTGYSGLSEPPVHTS